RHAGVARVGPLHGVHGQGTDGVGKFARCGHAAFVSGSRAAFEGGSGGPASAHAWGRRRRGAHFPPLAPDAQIALPGAPGAGRHRRCGRRGDLSSRRSRLERGHASQSWQSKGASARCRWPLTPYLGAPVLYWRGLVHCRGPKGFASLSLMSVLRLTHFTDPHLYGGESECLRGVATLPALRTALAHAQARDWPPAAVLVTGDLVQDDPAGYPHFRRLFGSLGVPVLCLPGNHDEPRAMRRELSGEPFRLDGHVDMGRWRIVLLDSCIPGAAGGALSAQGLAELDQALATADGRHCLVCLHHHPVAMSSRWLDRVGLTNAAEFLHTLDQHRNV